MYRYKVPQKTLVIGNVKVGGIPAQNPTVLIGSIFYHGDKLVQEKEGVFDRQKAETVLQKQAEIADKTDMPAMLDVVGPTPESMLTYLEFIVDHTQVPLLIDGAGNWPSAIAGLHFAREQGFLDRCVYNSLLPEAGLDEKQALKETGVKNVLLLTYGDAIKLVSSSEFRLETARSLVNTATEIGIPNCMVDTVVLDIPTLGLASRGIQLVKDELGLPAGCGAHNSVDKWKGLKEKFDKTLLKMPALAVSNALPVILGADFVLYGPVQHAEVIFPLIGFVNTAYVQLLREQGIRITKDQPHPRWKIG